MDDRVAQYPSLMPFATRWTSLGNYSRNLEPFDSRTDEWLQVYNAILSCDLKYKNVDIMTAYMSPPNRDDLAHLKESDLVSCRCSAISSMVSSPFCLDVQERGTQFLMATMGPLKDVLPFLWNLFTNPSPDSLEFRYPPGKYMRTMWLQISDIHIVVRIYRNVEATDC